MARRNLLTAEMIGLSAALLDSARHRPVLTASPLLAPLVPEIEDAHRALVTFAPSNDTAVSSDLAALQIEARETDQRHDAKGGGVLTVLEGLHRLAETDEEATRIATVRDALFPEGAAVFAMSFKAESGNAERVELALARKDVKELLRAVAVRPGATLYDEARAYVKAGQRLGVLESRKAVLEAPATPAEADDGPRGSIVTARNDWLQVVDLLVRAAKRLKGTHATAWSAVAREIAMVETKADERAARNRGTAPDTDAEPDAPGNR